MLPVSGVGGSGLSSKSFDERKVGDDGASVGEPGDTGDTGDSAEAEDTGDTGDTGVTGVAE